MDIIGKKILNYKIVALLGKGGMGAVYLAEHENIDNQRAAIKVINADMVNDYTRNLLKDEATLLSGLHHQNIVSFLDFHIDEAGNLYLIMEYAEGESLASYLNNINGLIVESRICPIFEPILDGVGYAHKKGILHRDIKPANIVIGSDGTPKILDFGIAKIMNSTEGDQKDELIMGTPSYMSPEQVRGEPLDQRSDVYSLGVLLHQMLTGNAPYDTTTLTEQDINRMVVEEPLPRMRTYYKYVSDKVQQVVDKATAKNPADRYQSCEEMKHALHRAIYPWRPSTWMKIAAVAVLAILIGGGYWLWDFNRTKVAYYKDYVEVWGVPQGIGKLSKSEHSHRHHSYMLTSRRHKLLSVKYVNSLDNIIEQTNSIYADRPLWQEFSYNENGKVSRVYVKDRNGKTLYVKCYNDKLNTMIYQFDDEHGSEKVVSNNESANAFYLSDTEDDYLTNNVRNGRISRHWLEYDENGYLVKVQYASFDNSPTCDASGIYGYRYVRDKKGRTIEVHFLGNDSKPKSTNWGLSIKKFSYDEEDYMIRAEYLAYDGSTATEINGGPQIVVWQYDKYGNMEYEKYQNSDGSPDYPKLASHVGEHNVYDEKGMLIQTECLDDNNNLMYVKNYGYSMIRWEYDDNGYISKISSFDTEGNPVENNQGSAYVIMVNDDYGNVLEKWNYTIDGSLVSDPNGLAGIKNQYDSLGNCVLTVNYGVDHNPCEDKSSPGQYGLKREYNDKGQLVREINLGPDLNPAPNINNLCISDLKYDNHGNQIEGRFFAPDGVTPVKALVDVYGLAFTYDEKGNMAEATSIDSNGNPMNSNQGYAKTLYGYDENNYRTSLSFFDANNRPVAPKGWSSCHFIVDAHGNVLETKLLGLDGKPSKNNKITRYKYDEHDNKIEKSFYNSNEKPTSDVIGVHRYEYEYNSRRQTTEGRCYGTNGKLVLNSYKYAVEKIERDARGNAIKRSYYDTELKPCTTADKWSSATYVYDAYGNIIRQCFFDKDGKPMDPKLMPPVGIFEYDNHGNKILIAAQDGNGNYINYGTEKWSIQRMTYDKRGNQTSESYFSKDDKPVLCNLGYHRSVYSYDELNRIVETKYYNVDGKPMLVNGFHIERSKYSGSSSLQSEIAYYGTNGKPINTKAGFHKVVGTYNADNTQALTRKFYDASGTLLLNEKWNGSKWVTVNVSNENTSGSSWKEVAAEVAKMCPYDLGEQLGHLTMTAVNVVGDNTCEIIFFFPGASVSDLDAETINAMRTELSTIGDTYLEALDHEPHINIILQGNDGKTICTVRK